MRVFVMTIDQSNAGESKLIKPQLAFYVNLHRAVIGPSGTLTGRWRPDIDLRRMLTGTGIHIDKMPSNFFVKGFKSYAKRGDDVHFHRPPWRNEKKKKKKLTNAKMKCEDWKKNWWVSFRQQMVGHVIEVFGTSLIGFTEVLLTIFLVLYISTDRLKLTV